MEICVRRRRLSLCAFNRMCVRIGVSNVDLLIQELQTLNHVHLSSPLAGWDGDLWYVLPYLHNFKHRLNWMTATTVIEEQLHEVSWNLYLAFLNLCFSFAVVKWIGMSSCGGLDNGSKRSHHFEGSIGFGQLHGLRENEAFCDQKAND